MAEYIDFEAEASGQSSGDDIEMSDWDEDFIDDSVQNNDEPSFYGFVNETLDPKVVLAECAAEETKKAETLEASNYQFDNDFTEEGPQILDQFDNFEKRVTKFHETFLNPIEEQTPENSLFSALVYAIRYKKNEKKDLVSEDCLKKDIGDSFYDSLVGLKTIMILDLDYSNFGKTCYETNDLLMKNGYFLRIYELKEKFRYVTHDNPSKKT